MRYLLVSHIPFARMADGAVMIDGLWARDLDGLAAALGGIRIVAPEVSLSSPTVDGMQPPPSFAWGPSSVRVAPSSSFTFSGFPPISSRWDRWRWASLRTVLRREVAWADVVHSSNVFPPYVGLSYAHDEAMRRGKPTVFVIAEDFYDMLEWEWVRLAQGRIARWRRYRVLQALDARVRRSAATASLTFLHTPAAVARYRLSTRNGVAIRQPEHEVEDVITQAAVAEKCAAVLKGSTLQIVAACRHKALKGLDFLIRAIGILAMRGVRVEARLFGSGEMTDQLRTEVEQLGIADQVFFPGALPPGIAILRAIAHGHVFAMPHRTMDFGRAFFDAMAGGTPVIAFRTAASAETVRDGVDGLLAPLDDAEGLAVVIERFHKDRAFLARSIEAARARALIDTRSAWHRFRAMHIKTLLQTAAPHVDAPSQELTPLFVGQA